jgi:hypothetical protein
VNSILLKSCYYVRVWAIYVVVCTRHFQESSRTVVTNGQTLERMEQITHTICKTNATNSADISRKDITVCSYASAKLPDRRGTVRALRDPRVNAPCLGIGHLVVKHCSLPWFHQTAVALLGLIRLIYLFVMAFLQSRLVN